MSQIEPICHFCKEHSSQNKRLYFRQMTQINPHPIVLCERCIELLYATVKRVKNPAAEKSAKSKVELTNFTPKDVFHHLNKNIIGQDEAKKTVSVAVYQHFERLKNPALTHKSNILIVGPTGSGKTEIARSIASFLNVPFVQVDVTTMTPRGYVGDSPEVCIEKLLAAAGGNVQAAEKGIVFLDEFDKIPSGSEWSSFKSKAVQQELLRLIESDKVDIKIGGEQGQKVTIDTSKILFIAAGSFAGLETFINSDNKKTIGFGATFESTKETTAQDLSLKAENRHFEAFGLIPEMLGRLPVICYTQALTEADLCRILSEPSGSVLNHYQALFESAGSKLVVTHDCLMALSKNAIKDKLGARGLKKQLEAKLKDLLFEISDYRGQIVTVSEAGFVIAPMEDVDDKSAAQES